MNLVADESVEQQIVDSLRSSGWDVYFVTKQQPGISDDIVLLIANERNALLLTGDKDFGEMVYRQGLVYGGVILVRLGGLQPETKGQVVARVMTERRLELLNSFTVISPGSVRIRRKR